MPSSCPLCRSEFDTLNERRDNILGQLPTGKLSVIKYSAVHLIVPLMIGFNAGFYKKILIILHFLSWQLACLFQKGLPTNMLNYRKAQNVSLIGPHWESYSTLYTTYKYTQKIKKS